MRNGLIIIALCFVFRVSAQEQSKVLRSGYPITNPVMTGTHEEIIHKIHIIIDSAVMFIYKQPDSARVLLRKAFRLSQDIEYNKGMANSLMTYGALYDELGRPDTAIEYFRKALLYARKVPSSQTALVEMIQNNIALDYAYMGLYKEAAEYFFHAIAQADTSKPYAHLYNNVTIVLGYLKEYEKSMEYLQQGKAHAMRHAREHQLLPYFYLNEAEALKKLGYYDSAMKSVSRAIAMAQDQQSSILVQQAYYVAGGIFHEQKAYAQAISQYRKAYHINTEYPMGRMRASIALGRVYSDIYQYDSAGKYLQIALPLSQQLQMPSELAEIYSIMGTVYDATGRHAAAYRYERMGNELRDSLVNLDRMRFVNLMDVKYQTTKKDKELVEKKLTIVNQRATLIRKNILIGSISGGSLLLLIFFIVFYRYRTSLQKKQEEITAWHAMSEGEEKERTRMARELHDGIGGSLSTLKMYLSTIQKRYGVLADTKDYNEAMRLLDNTLEDVRQTAHNLIPELLLRHGLPEAVRIFCSSIPATPNLSIDFQYYGFIDKFSNNFQLAVYRIIQELVQNIIKHADATFAVVQLSQHGNIFSVTVEDNGRGMDTENTPDAGLGLQSIRHRIHELNGLFILTSSPGKGTVAYFEFNLQSQKKISA